MFEEMFQTQTQNPVWEWIKNIFAWDPASPLTFMNLFFWGFFAVVLLGYSIVYRFNLARTVFLLLVSFFFYFKTSGFFIILLLFTITNDYFLGMGISKAKTQGRKKLFLTISIICNLTLLGYFKYAYFFHESFNQITGNALPFFNHYAQFSNTCFGTEFRVDKLILPVGISFFTFQSISYIVDLYREKVKPVKNILEYGFFVCFFPHLVAGPIVKAHEFLWQINLPYKLTRLDFGMALFWIINGFAKKILADYIALNYIDRIFENPNYYSGVEVIFGIFGYSLQIYADFSGYTDIAIGVALLLGFRLKTNFRSPYKAASTSEFWQRWHISLSSWLKEYLYIPLGGNKKGSVGSYLCISLIALVVILLTGKLWLLFIFAAVAVLLFVLTYFISAFKQALNTNINLLVTMLLGGLWHGSSWMFIIWGGLNGLGLIIHKLWQKIVPFTSPSTSYRILMILFTLTFISFTRIWFRSANLETVGFIFDRIQNHMGWELIWDILWGYRVVLAVMIVGYLIHWIPERFKNVYRTAFAGMPVPAMALTVIFAVFLLYQAMSSEMQPFIYFQF
ncbi:MAG: alginate O-acetyltransferase [Bacteroidetes bacterium]|jgi:D-alanyl-lipoteichoic acid acyltransferase DltB (MBOAT superfamily)|nr:alginate O-acetyltransferase [Bacteroidota bacterium]